MSSEKAQNEDSLHTEYAAANDAYMHYDGFSWQVGAVLIAGSFIFWGFLIDQSITPSLLVVGSALVTILMSVWMLYSQHNRQIYLCKLHRLREIEAILGLEQHRRWVVQGDETESVYRTFGPSGHELDALIYVVTALGAPLIGVFKIGLYLWLGLPVLLVVVVLIWISRNERAFENHLRQISEKGNTG